MKNGLEVAQDEMDKACDSFKQMQSKEDISAHGKEIWNAAIEACLDKIKHSKSTVDYVEEIRKLKK